MPPLTLYHLAKKACIKNIRSITDVGDLPYEFIRPMLLKLENPAQLRELEKASPQLCGVDAEIWREFIKRDVPNWEDKPHEPKNPENWYKVYRKLRQDSDKEVDKDAEILKAAMEGIKYEREKHTSKIVDPKTVPRLPRMGGMRVEGGRSKAITSSSGNPSILSFASGSKTKMLTGKGVLERARREAKELSFFSSRKSLLATPTHKLIGKASHVQSAPRGMVDEYRKPPAPVQADQPLKATTIFAPRKRKVSEAGTSTALTVEERERRLKAFTNRDQTATSQLSPPQTPAKPAGLSPSPSRSAASESRTGLLVGTSYKAPRLSPSADSRHIQRPVKQKAPVNPFMPAKRRKIA